MLRLVVLVCLMAASGQSQGLNCKDQWWEPQCEKQNVEPTPPPRIDDAKPLIQSAPNGQQCICVPYYQCKEDKILTFGEGIIDIRKKPKPGVQPKSELVGGGCPGSVEVCCQLPPGKTSLGENGIPVPPPPGPEPGVGPAPGGPGPAPVPGGVGPGPVPVPGGVGPAPGAGGVGPAPVPPAPAHNSVCGVRNKDGLHIRITNFRDNESQFGEFPWMTAVLNSRLINGKEQDVYQCGGSLIHPQVVLTVAHCVARKETAGLKVRLGEWDTQSEGEFIPHQDIPVADVVIHENFVQAGVLNDFALLFLAQPARLSPEVDVVCLPDNSGFDGNKCIVNGWGKDQFGKEGRYQHILKKLDLPVVARDVCQNSLRSTRLGRFFLLHDSFICAGGEPGKDTCKGDGGSPLVCQRPDGRYAQVGLVAWGIGCGGDTPGVYAGVEYAKDWILGKLQQRNIRL